MLEISNNVKSSIATGNLHQYTATDDTAEAVDKYQGTQRTLSTLRARNEILSVRYLEFSYLS